MEDTIKNNDMYYIMDLSKNYYRIDSQNQLVAAAGKECAGVFTMRDVFNKVGGGKRASFYNVVSIDGSKIINCSMLPESEKISDNDAEECRKEIIAAEYDISKLDWCDYLRNFCYLISTAGDYLSDLKKQESDADLEICDLLHYIELFEIRENEETQLIQHLKDVRHRRRDVKDAMDAVKQFQETIGISSNLLKAQKLLKHLEDLKHRHYTPRKLPELFNNGVKENRNLLKCNSEIESDMEATKVDMVEDRRVVNMSEVRRDTVFDTKKMDWLQFAKEQVEFYKNAEQHIVNLQIDIRDIDEEIESTLEKIEEGSFSAVQGYMVFKRLRDLRTERKEKLQELESVSILVEPFNCDAIKEHFEDSVEEIQSLNPPKTDEENQDVG